MPNSNPYQPSSQPSEAARDGHTKMGKRRVLSAWMLGSVCCLIGPAFLTLYYQYHEIEFAGWMLYLFGLAYFGPGLMFVGFGLVIGYFLAPFVPQFNRKTRRWLIGSVIVLGYSISINSLLGDQLNFAVVTPFSSLPAFSVVCASIAFVATTLHLAMRIETPDKMEDD
ncbi:MAG: hypothetical protein AAGG48_20925 [Planctomycetota bacterium]